MLLSRAYCYERCIGGRRGLAFGLHGDDAVGGDIFGEELRPALGSKLCDGAHRDTESMRVAEASVYPGLGVGSQIVGAYLTRSDHDLPVVAIDGVAVDIGDVEIVVEAYFLDLFVYV